ncbi:MAG: amidohydrolase family protein [Acidobacteria bacterium]|nr:amidohydrolase family protein [Acidobacteriota bacterium]
MKRNILAGLIISLSILVASPATGESGDNSEYLLLKNGNIIPVTSDNIPSGDILIKGNKIIKIGKSLTAPEGAKIIDLDGKYAMPGIVDSHSHTAIEADVSEISVYLTPEVHIKDVIDDEDMSILYALSGGVTTIHTMIGSSNPVGGTNIVLKLRWGKSADELIFKEAPETIKWALGENPKQSTFPTREDKYPTTRMGVEASIRALFEKAKDYKAEWAQYRDAKKKGLDPIPPRKDYGMEVMSDVLDGKIWIRCHAYQSEEMLSVAKLCKEYGVKLGAFEHGPEGYRIANELAEMGVPVSGFVDAWSYKWEAYFTMPHHLAYLMKRGVLVAINSDSDVKMRRLFIDAARLMRFGGLTENEALRTITINPAIILGVEKYIGSLETGKQADIAIFTRHPLDPFTRVEMTIVDGQVVFDRVQYHADLQKLADEEKKAEESKKEKKQENKKKPEKPVKSEVI